MGSGSYEQIPLGEGARHQLRQTIVRNVVVGVLFTAVVLGAFVIARGSEAGPPEEESRTAGGLFLAVCVVAVVLLVAAWSFIGWRIRYEILDLRGGRALRYEGAVSYVRNEVTDTPEVLELQADGLHLKTRHLALVRLVSGVPANHWQPPVPMTIEFTPNAREIVALNCRTPELDYRASCQPARQHA